MVVRKHRGTFIRQKDPEFIAAKERYDAFMRKFNGKETKSEGK
jgi:hypothetical protein